MLNVIVFYMNAITYHSGSGWERVREGVGIGHYQGRTSTSTDLYGLVHHYYEKLIEVWESCYEQEYGFLRPVVEATFKAYLDCGRFENGCVRIRCPDCCHELYVPFSCQKKGVCPSCAAKRAVLFGEKLHEEILLLVPHHHIVFTLPKRYRGYFKSRNLLPIIFKAAWKAIRVCGGIDNHVPGAVMALHTAGETLKFHPHIHAIVTAGVFLEDDTFVRTWFDAGLLQAVFQEEVLRLLAKEIDGLALACEQTLSQVNTGFNVWVGEEVAADDVGRRCFLGRYLMRHPFPLGRIKIEDNQVKVISSKDDVVPTWKTTPLDFLARLSQHIPGCYEHLERFLGRYSSVTRGVRKPDHDGSDQEGGTDVDKPKTCSKKSRASWARCIKLVYEIDPMECPKCGSPMKVIAMLEPCTPGLDLPKLLEAAGIVATRAPPVFYPDLQPELNIEWT